MLSRRISPQFVRVQSAIPFANRGRSRGPALAALIGCGLVGFSRDARAEDEWFGSDKFLHFGFSAALASGGYATSSLVFEPKWARAASGFGVAVGIGAAKEGVDALGYGDPSAKDFAWDVAGALVGSTLALLVDDLLFDDGSDDELTGDGISTGQNPAGPTAMLTLRF